LPVRGLRLRARTFAGASGPPAILLHGWLDHSGSFDGLAPLLAADGPAVAIDLRGHGGSDWVGPGGFYHLSEYVADLDGALDQLGFDRVRLVGHSLGGAVSLLYAAARPERVEHATLIDALPLVIKPGEVPLRLTSYLDDLKAPRLRRRVGSVEEAADRLLRFNPRLARAAALHLARGGVAPDPAQGGALAWRWDPLLRAHSPLPFTEEALQAVVRAVRTPVLLVSAGEGFIGDAESARERMAALPDFEVRVLPGASHHLHLESPEAVAAPILQAWRSRRPAQQ
jgi:pimeloyl-ACP methyl ester carboxylesterase